MLLFHPLTWHFSTWHLFLYRMQLTSAEHEISELRPMIPLLQKEAAEAKATGKGRCSVALVVAVLCVCRVVSLRIAVEYLYCLWKVEWLSFVAISRARLPTSTTCGIVGCCSRLVSAPYSKRCARIPNCALPNPAFFLVLLLRMLASDEAAEQPERHGERAAGGGAPGRGEPCEGAQASRSRGMVHSVSHCLSQWVLDLSRASYVLWESELSPAGGAFLL